MSPIRKAALALALGGALLTASPAAAQLGTGGDVVDRVVALVGDSVVLSSQVLEEIETLKFQRQGFTVPPEDTDEYQQLFDAIRDQWINRLMVIQAAQRDTLIRLDEDRVTQVVTDEIEQRTREMGGQTAFQQALLAEGITLGQYRDLFRNQVRQSQIQQLYVQRRIQTAAPVEITEQELLAAFQQARAQLGQRPKRITFRQVVLEPEPTDSVKAAVRARAEALVDSLRAGADFAELARNVSDDAASGELGGDLGWFRRGQMVEEFEDAAFALAEGQISDVVETQFGYHIIQIQRIRSGERNGRHILLTLEITPADVERARDTAQAVMQRARDGASMADLYKQYTDPLVAPDSLTATAEELDQLPPPYGQLRLAAQDDVVGPLEYEDNIGTKHFAVVKVTRVREAGAYTLDDVRTQLAQQIRQQKHQDRILSDLRERTYIEIRD